MIKVISFGTISAVPTPTSLTPHTQFMSREKTGVDITKVPEGLEISHPSSQNVVTIPWSNLGHVVSVREKK